MWGGGGGGGVHGGPLWPTAYGDMLIRRVWEKAQTQEMQIYTRVDN